MSLPAFRTLTPGDPWTMILEAPILTETRQLADVGNVVSKWFATNEPGRLFKITSFRVHNPSGWTPQENRFIYETVYIGFEECPTQPA